MFTSSIGKKYLMALSGLVLIGFVFVHMAGNLQILMGQEKINAYAHALQSLPLPILWGSRLFLLAAVLIHAVTAYQLVKENRRARPNQNYIETTKRAGLASLKMGLTGSILLAFIIFHLLHFTIRTIYPEYSEMMTVVGSPDSNEIHDVYSMVLAGFQHTWISVFYVVAMFLLCGHLAHGVSSAFQSLGIRSESWRVKLELAAKAYAWLIFVGFSIVPLLVLAQNWGMIELFDINAGGQALASN
ncbi:MAG: succinate dehydrogenase cytochrome b subunit [Opitutales bacterium]|jgi:succinate dehydrogenase / fumarate reductase cytochrome b subunit|nr:succinate:quinone oxidoreductase [Opitutae bacterium]